MLKSLISKKEDLGEALNAGLATAVGAEIIEALKYVGKEDPYAGRGGNRNWLCPRPCNTVLWACLWSPVTSPAWLWVLGKSEDASAAADIVKDYQSKGILTFLVGDIIDQIADAGVKMGLEFRVVPLGHDVTAVTMRSPLPFARR